MGRGNYCPMGKLTDQWYIDYDNYSYHEEEDDADYVVYEGYDYDLCEEDIYNAMSEIQKRYPSFQPCDKYSNSEHGRYWGEHILLENSFFEIGMADNSWSAAIFIKERDDIECSGIAERHFKEYCDGIKNLLLNLFGEIYLRNGAWMSSVIRKEEVHA